MSPAHASATVPSVTAAVASLEVALSAAADLVAAGWLEALSDVDLLAVTVRLRGVASRAKALTVSAVAEVGDGEVATSQGFASTSAWLEARAGLSRRESRATIALGESLQWGFDATREAWLAGEVSAGAVQVITSLIPRRLKGLPEVDFVAARARLEVMALRLAKTGSVAVLRRGIERAVIAADPAGADAAAVAARESQFLSFTPVRDGVQVRGFLTWDAAGVVMSAFDQCHDARYRSGALTSDAAPDPGQEAAGAGAGDDGSGRDGVRDRMPVRVRQRREHRNAEIFTDLATRLLDEGALGSRHAQRPHLTVTVHADDLSSGLGGEVLLPGFGAVPVTGATVERVLCDAEVHPVLTRRPGAPPGDPDAPPGDSGGAQVDPDRPADHPGSRRDRYPGSVAGSSDPPWSPPLLPREGGGRQYAFPTAPVSDPVQVDGDTDLAAVIELGADLDDEVSWWNRLFGEPGRHVLDVGRSYRTAPPKLRRALTVRDGGCAAPECEVDASRCEAHHITYWRHHGETSISNMVLLCGKHHHMVHEGRWRIHRTTGLEPGNPGYITLVAPPRRP